MTKKSKDKPLTVSKRNARERSRIKTVNSAFDDLRNHVPSGRVSGKKISKVETLKSAIEYIKALQNIVENQKRLEKLENYETYGSYENFEKFEISENCENFENKLTFGH